MRAKLQNSAYQCVRYYSNHVWQAPKVMQLCYGNEKPLWGSHKSCDTKTSPPTECLRTHHSTITHTTGVQEFLSEACVCSIQLYFNNTYQYCYIGFEVLTAVVLKCSIFWIIRLCSTLAFSGLYGVMSQNIQLFNTVIHCFFNVWETRYEHNAHEDHLILLIS